MPEEEEMQMKANPMQRQEVPEEEEALQAKRDPLQRQGMPEEEEIQMKAVPVQRQEGGMGASGLPADVHTDMESSFGADFSDVHIHANSSQALDVGALAYTQGSDIHFAPGQFDPGSSQGRELIGHELTHVIQQREGRVPTTGTVNGQPLNDDAGLEREADEMGRKAAQFKRR
ncbi:MAG: DUF4157 domain-containing protein [Bacteroidetes bacterium]|nr:MAG: DUF4157 domain-containing protein [Bacteroidota bacterium]